MNSIADLPLKYNLIYSALLQLLLSGKYNFHQLKTGENTLTYKSIIYLCTFSYLNQYIASSKFTNLESTESDLYAF